MRCPGGVRAAVVLVLVTALVSGCGIGGFSGLYNAPLPGGAELGDDPYRVTAEFGDVLDLVPQAAVKVNDVPVGRVERVRLSDDNTTAEVTMLVNGDVRLPANADARLRQSSLLGEKFVELAAPESGAAAERLGDGAVIPVQRTNRNPQIEEVLGALSMLLNGGGVAQLQVIVREFNNGLSGNEAELRGLLDRLNHVVGRLDAQKENITRAIDGLNRLAISVRDQIGSVRVALRDLGPGIKVIEQQREQLVDMLRSLDKLSTVATDTVDRSREDLVADLRALGPTLEKLNETGDKLPKAIGYLATYPFPEYALKPLKGDYVNSDVYFDLNFDTLLGNLTRTSGPLLPLPGVNDDGEPGLVPPDLPVPLNPGQVPQVPDLPDPSELPGPPELPDLPDLPDGSQGGG